MPKNIVQRAAWNRALREGAALALGQAAAILGRVIGTRVLTGVVAPAIYGQAVLLQGVGVLGSNILCAPQLHAALRFFPEAQRVGRVREFRRILTQLLTIGVILTAAALAIGGLAWTSWFDRSYSLIAFLMVGGLVALEASRSFELNLLNAARQQRSVAVWSAVEGWARPLSAAGLVLVLGASPTVVLLGFLVGTAVGWAALRRRFVRASAGAAPEPDSDWVTQTRKDVLKFGKPMLPLAILGWVASVGDRYILGVYSGVEAAGLYSVAYGLAGAPFLAASGIVGMTLRPVLFDAVAREDHLLARRIFAKWVLSIAVISFAGVLLVWVCAPLIVRVALAPEYWPAESILVWLAVAFSVQAVQQVFEIVIYAKRKTRLFLAMQVGGTFVALLSYAVLIPRMGMMGAAVATLLSFTCSCILGACLARAGGGFFPADVSTHGGG